MKYTKAKQETIDEENENLMQIIKALNEDIPEEYLATIPTAQEYRAFEAYEQMITEKVAMLQHISSMRERIAKMRG